MLCSFSNCNSGLVWRLGLLIGMALFAINSTILRAEEAEQARSIVIAKEEAIYFTSSESRRSIQVNKMLPSSLDGFGRAYLKMTLSCPNQRCDPWDRVGFIKLRPSQAMAAAGHASELEIIRFVTPYGVGGNWTQDISDYMLYLTDEVTFEVFIDTWVGPGHEAGEGWLVSLELILTPGTRAKQVLAVVPILDFSRIDYGDPSNPAVRTGLLKEVGPATAMKIRSLISGHGQGNLQNCAEFCSKRHEIRVANQTWSRQVWRDNCHTSVNPNQPGNYFYPRAGWCPGDLVQPWYIDIQEPMPSEELSWRYQVEDYINTCRPDSPICQGCALGTACEYDGGRHTSPLYYTTVHAILYR
ncbi:MAG: peptide-N-glycosidase F-related protein [Oligoflexus sp.]